MLTDTNLARRTCALLGWKFDSLDEDEGAVIVEVPNLVQGGAPLNEPVSWPDLSVAARKHVVANGWVYGRASWEAGHAVVSLTNEAGRERLGHGDDPERALCAAACQTQDAAREEEGQ